MTHEVWVVRRAPATPPTEAAEPSRWCPVCAGPAEMVAPESAAALAGVSPRAVYRWIEAGRAHFAESPDGRVLVCLVSLPGPDG